MECEKKSKGWMTELVDASEVSHHKPLQLEAVLETLHIVIKGRGSHEIAEKNFMTIYENVRDINLKPFQETYEDLCEKYKKTQTQAPLVYR